MYAAHAPAIADLIGPGYVLAWTFETSGASPEQTPRALLVSDNGTARGGVIVVSPARQLSDRGAVRLASLSNGGFVVTFGNPYRLGALSTAGFQVRDGLGALVAAGETNLLHGDTFAVATAPVGGFAFFGVQGDDQGGARQLRVFGADGAERRRGSTRTSDNLERTSLVTLNGERFFVSGEEGPVNEPDGRIAGLLFENTLAQADARLIISGPSPRARSADSAALPDGRIVTVWADDASNIVASFLRVATS